MNVCHDIDTIRAMDLEELWANYMKAMDMAINSAAIGDNEMSFFFVAVVKVTLDAYFDGIEEALI